MASLARREIATTFYNDLRVSARTRLRTAKAEIENSVKLGTRTQEEAKKLIDDLQRQSDLLETQGRLLESQLDNAVLKSPRRKDKDFTSKYDLREEYTDVLMNFDRVGQLMHEARVGGFYMGGYKLPPTSLATPRML